MKRVVISCVVMCSIAKSKACFVGQGQGLERGQRRQGYLNASQSVSQLVSQSVSQLVSKLVSQGN